MKGFQYVKLRKVASPSDIRTAENAIGRDFPPELRTNLTMVSNGGFVNSNQICGHIASVQRMLDVVPGAGEGSIVRAWTLLRHSISTSFLPFAYCEFGDYLGLDNEDRVVFWNYQSSAPGEELEVVCDSFARLNTLVRSDDAVAKPYINPSLRHLFPHDEQPGEV